VLRLRAVEVPLEWIENLVYFRGDAYAPPHVPRSCAFWDIAYIQNIQERFFFRRFYGLRLVAGALTRHL
jgi:hypothetical protein